MNARSHARSAVMNPTSFEGRAAIDPVAACRLALGLALLSRSPCYVLKYGAQARYHITSVRPADDVEFFSVLPTGEVYTNTIVAKDIKA